MINKIHEQKTEFNVKKSLKIFMVDLIKKTNKKQTEVMKPHFITSKTRID